MKNTHTVLLTVLFLFCVNHTLASDYTLLRDEGKKSLSESNFADAKFKFEGARACATTSAEIAEITKLQSVLMDSIDKVFVRAFDLIDGDTEKALHLFEKLYDKQGRAMHDNLNAQLGLCYGRLNMLTKRRELWDKGVKENEQVAAYYLARLLGEKVLSTDSIIQLYTMAKDVPSARDSLGMIYYRQKKYNESYSWFKKNSKRPFSEYNRAKMLLDKSIFEQLSPEYKSDDPESLLESASNYADLENTQSEYAPALFELGLIKFKKDSQLGVKIIRIAAEKHHYFPACTWICEYDRMFSFPIGKAMKAKTKKQRRQLLKEYW